MWRRIQNLFHSVRTYADLSPDLRLRRQINRRLQARLALTSQEWFTRYWQPLGIPQTLSDFLYTHLPQYSGLDVARIRPDDRLNDDLFLPLVCWFDWQLTFCDDFFWQFGLDLSDSFDPEAYETLQDWVMGLHEQQMVKDSG